jgi:hypothetical protein
MKNHAGSTDLAECPAFLFARHVSRLHQKWIVEDGPHYATKVMYFSMDCISMIENSGLFVSNRHPFFLPHDANAIGPRVASFSSTCSR